MPSMGIVDAPPEVERRSLAGALLTTTQQRVLGLLFGQPERSFFANEIIKLTGAGAGAAQRELKKLSDARLLTVKPVGNQKHYQANAAAPIFAELYGIVRKTLGPGAVLRAALEPAAAQIDLALLYGSVAKGCDHAASDIDLLVVSDRLTLEALYTLLEAPEAELARPINPTLLTAAEFASRRQGGHPFLRRVLAGDTVALIGNVEAA